MKLQCNHNRQFIFRSNKAVRKPVDPPIHRQTCNLNNITTGRPTEVTLCFLPVSRRRQSLHHPVCRGSRRYAAATSHKQLDCSASNLLELQLTVVMMSVHAQVMLDSMTHCLLEQTIIHDNYTRQLMHMCARCWSIVSYPSCVVGHKVVIGEYGYQK